MRVLKDKVLNAPFRWAGSKKRVLNDMLELFDDTYDNYIEYFLGSGVVLINLLNNSNSLKYKNYYVNDINPHIINFYLELRDNCTKLIREVKKLANKYNSLEIKEKENFYYEIRASFNDITKHSIKQTAFFYFLMKTCFNGVYRENKYKEFNVPFGRKEKISIDVNSLEEISNLIKNVSFYNMDYKKFINEMRKDNLIDNSFIYCDPPYLPDDLLVYQKQMLYTVDSFDHNSFVEELKNIKKAKYIVSMSDSKIADSIYKDGGLEKYELMDILRVINPRRIFQSKEVIFSNFIIKKE